MSFRQKLSEKCGIEESLLPKSYQILGNIMLIKFMKIRKLSEKQNVAKAIKKLLPYVKTICEIKEIHGELRKPKVVKLLGRNTKTIHKENKILYKIDVSKVMFSKGNQNERKRLIGEIKDGETVVDMFAGIGYFSLGLAKFSKAIKIYAIEKNKNAMKYLKENIKLNKVKNIEPILGDCRQIKINEKPDRIIMGYFPGTDKFLPYALKMSKMGTKTGTIIHLHNTYRKDELWKKPVYDIKKACKKQRIKCKILLKKKVKSSAPNVFHVVVDFIVC